MRHLIYAQCWKSSFIQKWGGREVPSKLYLSVLLHMHGEISCSGPRWWVASFSFMIENEPADWVCLVSTQPSGTPCQGVRRHVSWAFTASINWPHWGIKIIGHRLKGFILPVCRTTHLSHQPLSLFLLLCFVLCRMSYKWNYTVCGLLILSSFT